MLKAEELRIGNIFSDKDYKYVTIAGIHPQSTNQITICINGCDYGDRLFKDLKPTPLTEEWLVNKTDFKFNKERKQYWISIKNYIITLHLEKGFLSFMVNNLQFRKLKGIHDLQNYVKSQTGEELTITT